MTRPVEHFSDPKDAFDLYGEPCSNCKHFNGYCEIGHRTKRIIYDRGHIAEGWVRKMWGCVDHDIKAGLWYGEEPVRKYSGVYGGSKTNILC